MDSPARGVCRVSIDCNGRGVMATYSVRVYETLMHTVEVEADSPEQAKEAGYEIVMNGPDSLYDTESCGTAEDMDVLEVVCLEK